MRKCAVFSPLVFMPVGMEIPIVLFIGVFGVGMMVPVRHCMIVTMGMIVVGMIVGMIVMRVIIVMPVVVIVMRVIMVMGMLMPFMCMSRSGLLHLPFLFLFNK